jgi:hypothetical protein
MAHNQKARMGEDALKNATLFDNKIIKVHAIHVKFPN